MTPLITRNSPEPIVVDRLVSQLTLVDCEIRGDSGVLVSGIEYDSRRVSPGDLFCCIPGLSSDGHDFAPAAAKAGARALLVERWIDAEPASELPQLKAPRARVAMADLACVYYGHPSRDMQVAGITGTNGKTSTAFMAESILRHAGLVTAIVGTVETRIADEVEPAGRTTPESPDLQELFWRMTKAGVEAVAIEVSSHALELERTAGTKFAVAAFTNLSQDHLDFHQTMEDYYRSKRKLFEHGLAGPAVINADDPWAVRIPDELPDLETISYSLDPSSGASLVARDINYSGDVGEFVIDGAMGRWSVNLAIPARFAISNALAAAGIAFGLGIDGSSVAAGLSAIRSIPGRFEPVRRDQPFLVIVDYAHTPDAVASVLASARGRVGEGGRLYVVIGCGGDRDRAKRPLMAKAAVDGADFTYLTSDNPRSEEPRQIIEEMLAGLGDGDEDSYAVEIDRRGAIAAALGSARSGDAVVIAGKGHESGQTIGGETLPFDDRIVAGEELEALGYGEAGI